MGLEHVEHSRKVEVKEWMRESWLVDNVVPEIVEPLLSNAHFLVNGGFLALSTPSPLDRSSFYRDDAHVIRSLAPWYTWMRDNAYRSFEWSGEPASFIARTPEERGICDLYTTLYHGLLSERGLGKDIDYLSRWYIRAANLGLESDVGKLRVARYVRAGDRDYSLPFRVHLPFEIALRVALGKRGLNYFQVEETIKQFSQAYRIIPEGERIEMTIGEYFFPKDITYPKENYLGVEDLLILNDAIRGGYQPFLEIGPPGWKMSWKNKEKGYELGANLAALEPDQIFALANGEHCTPDCQYYHGHVKELKELGELIAPVDAEFFGWFLYERYKKWRENKIFERFRVLIPAQADETTIAGMLDYLLSQEGITEQNIIDDFSFQLADLCVTPLLKIYAELKRRGLLQAMKDNIRIRSMDVFRWQDQEEKFDFICSDHFIDLFPPEDKEGFTQKNLLLSLVRSLAPGGQLVLTTRCGSEQNPLDKERLLKDFYQKTGKHIKKLVKKLENPDKKVNVTAIVHEIIALLFYRQLRDVYPFEKRHQLNELLGEVKRELEGDVDYIVLQRGEKEGKAVIMITKRGLNRTRF